LRKNIREHDVAGRYGGEEFLLILDNADLNTAKEICERIRTGIEKYHYDNDIRITISGGVAEYHGESATELIESADENLYEAKRLGRNRII
jgi:diguanylate cyclase (GGDEF)-like protein